LCELSHQDAAETLTPTTPLTPDASTVHLADCLMKARPTRMQTRIRLHGRSY
jgi:hypothetical protein